MIARIIVAVLLSCSGALAGQGMGPGPGVKGYASSPGYTFVDTAELESQEPLSNVITTADSLVTNAGDLVVCFVSGGDLDYHVESITCGVNTLTKLTETVGLYDYPYAAFYKENAAASSSTCTATWNEYVQYRGISCVSYSGVAATSSVDQTACDTPGCSGMGGMSDGPNITTQNVTTTNTYDINIVGVQLWDNPAVLTGSAPYTNRGSSSGIMHILDRQTSSTGAYPNQTVGTISTVDTYLALNLTFKLQ